MDHPLISEDQKGLRKRVVQFFHNSYKVQRESNIVFVCGGNDPKHMRPKFRNYCIANNCKYELFQPEFAMENLFANGLKEPFDISDFEELVGSLSHCIVIFPEAAGSFAETGYFSAREELAKKTILVMDSGRQKTDSFISLGPAKKINDTSIYNPVIQLDYKKPIFDLIITRIDSRSGLSKNRKLLNWTELNQLSDFEFFCLIFEIVNFLTVSTIDDIEFMLRSMSSAHLSIVKFRQLTSILVGAGYLEQIGEFGHLKVNKQKDFLLLVKEGERDKRNELSLLLAEIYQDADAEFKQLLEGI